MRSGREVSPQVRPLVVRGVEAALGVHFAVGGPCPIPPSRVRRVHSAGARGRTAPRSPAGTPAPGPENRPIRSYLCRCRSKGLGDREAPREREGWWSACETSAVPGADRGKIVARRPLDPQFRPARGQHAAEWMEPLTLGGEVHLCPLGTEHPLCFLAGRKLPVRRHEGTAGVVPAALLGDRRSCDG